jgi:isopentenyl diphosphate isomerase/L-lactate dehydrogenase-like FMN-dependent dehydrogenase/biotin carboxylase
MTKKGIVILGGGLLQSPLIQSAKKRGWFVLVCDKNPQALAAGLGDVFLPVSTRDSDELIQSLEPYRGSFHLCATLGTDMTVSMAAINDAFGLPGLHPLQAAVTTHKGKMRQFLASIGLNQPAFFVTTKRNEAIQWVEKTCSNSGYVIKPIHNMGARGVMFFKYPHELSFAFEFAQSEAETLEVIIEQYIPADELSVDVLVLNGSVYITGLADRNIELKEGRYFIETGHTMPTQRQPNIYDRLKIDLEKVSCELGNIANSNYTGALKGDIRITPENQIVIGEIATRLSGGFMSTHTFPYSSGIDLVSSYLDILDGKTPEFIHQKNFNQYLNVTIERAVITSPGIVEKINIPSAIDHNNAVLKNTFIHYKENDSVSSLQCNLGKAANLIISADSLSGAEDCFYEIIKQSEISVNLKVLSRKDLNNLARNNFNKNFCRVCKICDGLNCASGVPGMGGIDSMESFQDNIRSLSEIKINYGQKWSSKVDTTANFLGREISIPVLNAPITGSITNMGRSITEYDLAVETAEGLKQFNLPALFGDGADPWKYFTAIEAIRQSGGGFMVIKPRADNREIIKRINDLEAAGGNGWGMDIDALSLPTMKLKNQVLGEKTQKDFSEICSHTKLPFFIKGIMTPEKGLEAASWGASAIIVSNHGGRVNNNLPGAARVIEEISKKVRSKFPYVQIFTDGGIRSGEDVFKMISLGADGVFIGRPLTIAAVATGRLGVYSVLKTYQEELEKTMKMTNTQNISEIKNFFGRSGIKNSIYNS